MTDLLQPMLLGMDWMDPNWLLDNFGDQLFWLSLAIIFVECGLFFPFLPGDTLLFAMGLFIAGEKIDVVPGPPVVDLLVALLLFTAAAFLGNVVGYEIGRGIGPPLYERNGRILKQKYFDQTTAFFDKHGNKALVIGRFVPFVRTYITVVAGVTRMSRARFFVWSAVGAVMWATGITLLGHALGNVKFIHNHLESALILLVLISLIPMVVEYFLAKRRNRTATPAADAPRHAAPKSPVTNHTND